MGAVLILTMVLISVAFVLTVVSLAVPVWSSSSSDATASYTITTHTYTGLWTTCSWLEVKDKSTLDCDLYTENDLLDYSSNTKAAQAMLIIGGGLAAASLVLVILKCCIFSSSSMLGKVVTLVCFGAALFLLIGDIVWGTGVKKDQGFSISDLNVGFAFSIVAAAIFVIAGVAMCFIED